MSLSNGEIEQNIVNALFQLHNLKLVNDEVEGVAIGVDINNIWSGIGFYSRKTPRKIVKVGYWIDKRNVNYRQKQDGTFSYDKIANKIAEMYHNKVEETKLNQIRKQRANLSEKRTKCIKQNIGLSEYSSIVKPSNFDPTVTVKLSGLSSQQAEALLKAAIEIGIDLK